MKRIRSEVEYKVPHWNFCNRDDNELHRVPKELCQFCVKTKDGTTQCMLHNVTLRRVGGFVEKAKACCDATVGIRATIVADNVEAPLPEVDPKLLITQTIDLYSKTVNALLNQGYPRPIAENVAKQHIANN